MSAWFKKPRSSNKLVPESTARSNEPPDQFNSRTTTKISVVIFKMAAKVVGLLVFIALMRQASTVTTVTDALNRMLIQPFCQRTSVRSITDVCVTVAPEKVDNTLCKDYLTTQSNGKLIASYYEGSERWCSFAIYTKGTKIHVRCQMGDPKFSIGSDWLDIHPLDSSSGKTLKIIDATVGSAVAGDFNGGATIIVSGTSDVNCTWNAI